MLEDFPPRLVELDCGCRWWLHAEPVWPRRVCADTRHLDEVEGAEAALRMMGMGWAGRTRMDCGCKLWVVQA